MNFTPVNNLEAELVSVRSGHVPMTSFLRLLCASDLYVPSANEVGQDWSGLQPVIFDKEGVQMVACFTALERIADASKLAPYCLTIRGGEFLRRIPHEFGLVVNPGHEVGFDVPPIGLRKIISEFA
ncbi:SseB family protein [Asticcacaulis biprosthecium]|nr:SseB family protein [Asticcacaulis biprosthecium]